MQHIPFWNQSVIPTFARIMVAKSIDQEIPDRYIDLLVDLQLLRRLRPWSGNLGKRLSVDAARSWVLSMQAKICLNLN